MEKGASRAEPGSPFWLAEVLDGIAAKSSALFLHRARSPLFLRACAFALGALFFLPDCVSFPGAGDDFYRRFGQYSFFVFSLQGAGALLIFFSLFYGWRARVIARPAASICVTAALSLLMNYRYFRGVDFPALAVGFVFLGAGVYTVMGLARAWPWKKKFALYVLVLFLAYSLTALWPAENARVFRGTVFLFRTLLFLAPLVVGQAFCLAPNATLGAALAFAFSPVQYIYQSLPIPPRMLQAGDDRGAEGLLNLLGGAALLCLAALALECRRALPGADSAGAYLLRGWSNYLVYYFGFLGTLHCAVGVGRWLGYALTSPAHHALLAASPIDRWKRWNYYFYWFYLTFVWLPLARRGGSLILATMAVFALNFFWHSPVLVGEWLASPRDPALHSLVLRVLGFYAGHALLVCASFPLQKYFPAESRRASWVGVGLCHLSMAVLYGLV